MGPTRGPPHAPYGLGGMGGWKEHRGWEAMECPEPRWGTEIGTLFNGVGKRVEEVSSGTPHNAMLRLLGGPLFLDCGCRPQRSCRFIAAKSTCLANEIRSACLEKSRWRVVGPVRGNCASFSSVGFDKIEEYFSIFGISSSFLCARSRRHRHPSSSNTPSRQRRCMSPPFGP